MPYFSSSDGVNLFYQEIGAGAPIIFLHGFESDYRNWSLQLRGLARSFRCFALSARGYYPSEIPKTKEFYSQSRVARDVLEFVRSKELHRVHLVGHSMGGYTALTCGLIAPEIIGSITVVSCGWGSNPDDASGRDEFCERVANLFTTKTAEEAANEYAADSMREAFRRKDPLGFEQFVQWLAEHSQIGMALTIRNIQKLRPTLYELGDQLAKMYLPVSIVVGDEDLPCLEGGVFLKKILSKSRLTVLGDTGHTLPSEEPEKLNYIIREFILSNS